MQPIRRFFSTLTTRQQQQQSTTRHLQKHNISAPVSHGFGRPSKQFLSIKSATNRLKRVALYPLNSVARFILRAIFQVGGDNAILATTSIDRVLKYSHGTLPIQRTNNSRVEQATMRNNDANTSDKDEEQGAANRSDTQKLSESKPNNKLAEFENPESGKTLDSLREAYAKHSKDASSVWLDFANESCYIYLYRGGGEPNQTLAAFDLDGTLIKPRSNKRIPRSATDWEFFSVWTKIKLQQCLREKRSRFVIFTNQNGIGLEIVPLKEVQHRIELVTKSIDIPCTIFMAVEKDIFRKPQTGMFQLFNESFNDSLPIDRSESFYCGDAIGYPSHSDADIKFAKQLGLPFITPEKFLRGVKPKLVT